MCANIDVVHWHRLVTFITCWQFKGIVCSLFSKRNVCNLKPYYFVLPIVLNVKFRYKIAWFLCFLFTVTSIHVVKFINISRLLSIPHKWLNHRGKRVVYSSQPGLLVGHVELGQLTYPLTAPRNGKTPLFRVDNATNQMMSKKKESLCLNDYLWTFF